MILSNQNKIVNLFIMSSLLFITCLQLQAQTLIWAKDGHPDGLQVNSVAFSPNGAYILSGTNCHPAKIRLYNTSDGSLNWDYTVSSSLECMMGVGMSANSQFLASAEETGSVVKNLKRAHSRYHLGKVYP